MKTRESGMPPEGSWNSFFSPQKTLLALGLTERCSTAVDFGCGYGTFSIPAARLIRGTVYALDIDPEMVAVTKAKADAEHLPNLVARQCDFDESGTGLDDAMADYVMLFNILHTERPYALLREARRILNRSGILAVMHWNYDSTTPRGPSMGIRLRPQQCIDIVREFGFTIEMNALTQIPPYHYGFVASRAE